MRADVYRPAICLVALFSNTKVDISGKAPYAVRGLLDVAEYRGSRSTCLNNNLKIIGGSQMKVISILAISLGLTLAQTSHAEVTTYA